MNKQNDVMEDDVQKEVKKFEDEYTKFGVSAWEVKAFELGYLKAKENTYTEEQMKQCWLTSFCDALNIDKESYNPTDLVNFKRFIQSLKQPK